MDNKVSAYRQELAELQARLTDPGVFSTPDYPRLAKRLSELQDLVALFEDLERIKKEETDAGELVEAGGELGELAVDELEDLRVRRVATEQALTAALTPKDPNDDHNAIFEIRAAAGGDESSLFAS